MEFGILFTSHPNQDVEPYPRRDVHARVTREILRADQLGFDYAWLDEMGQVLDCTYRTAAPAVRAIL